ncbi:MAG: putative toxin-antitoxin system toxin component, PIN family, partial [Cyanobacteria bacterium J06648_11]
MIPYTVLLEGGNIQTVIDTNIVYAGLYSSKGASHQVLKAVLAKRVQPVMSVALLFEYEDVLKRSSQQLGIEHDDIDSLLDVICSLCLVQKIHYLWRPFLPDPKDDFVLELAVASGFKSITTGNEFFALSITSKSRPAVN